MTYTVFGATLNLTQSSPIHGLTKPMAMSGCDVVSGFIFGDLGNGKSLK